ncbi:hypothetical protein OUZ56_027406 [Daphnia magna]|uniref:Uncharacterized protein n=1 Tax=Daphnia magna TaxID=35525 RepID=A0ABQ9ZPN9_9CRUS|nr:hypothetical protein OUZ56_027406 [Daphnia magna]
MVNHEGSNESSDSIRVLFRLDGLGSEYVVGFSHKLPIVNNQQTKTTSCKLNGVLTRPMQAGRGNANRSKLDFIDGKGQKEQLIAEGQHDRLSPGIDIATEIAFYLQLDALLVH